MHISLPLLTYLAVLGVAAGRLDEMHELVIIVVMGDIVTPIMLLITMPILQLNRLAGTGEVDAYPE